MIPGLTKKINQVMTNTSYLQGEVDNHFDLDTSNTKFLQATELVLNTNRNLFLTGKAGTGKSTFIKYIKQNDKKSCALLAPTGIAAVNIGGQTIHSFFKIPPNDIFPPNDVRLERNSGKKHPTIYEAFKYNRIQLEVLKNIELLIIDEISMVRCELLDLIDKILRVYRHNINPFGGVQIVLVGDAFQLAPIAEYSIWQMLKMHYTSPYFFSSHVFKHMLRETGEKSITVIELEKVYRQNELEFIHLLNCVRIGSVSESDLKKLNERYDPLFKPDAGSGYLTLTTHKKPAKEINETRLDELKSKLYTFQAQVSGEFPETAFPTDRILNIKEGAQVLIIKNTQNHYNGQIARIKTLSNTNEETKIVLELINDQKGEILLEKSIWENSKHTWDEVEKRVKSEVIGTFIQYPITLGWAITVHKSQGMSLNKVVADLGSSFAAGQAYVGLSRCTSFNGLVLKTKLTDKSIITAPEALAFAQYQTPESLIINALEEGKADRLYSLARISLAEGSAQEAFSNYLEAIKFRNDTQTDVFKRYLLTHLSRLMHIKLNYNKIAEELTEMRLSSNRLGKKLNEIQSNYNEQKVKLEKYSIEITRLREVNKSQENVITSIEEKYNAALEKTAENHSNEINYLQNISSLKDEILILNKEISRLKSISWYKKLFGLS